MAHYEAIHGGTCTGSSPLKLAFVPRKRQLSRAQRPASPQMWN